MRVCLYVLFLHVSYYCADIINIHQLIIMKLAQADRDFQFHGIVLLLTSLLSATSLLSIP